MKQEFLSELKQPKKTKQNHKEAIISVTKHRKINLKLAYNKKTKQKKTKSNISLNPKSFDSKFQCQISTNKHGIADNNTKQSAKKQKQTPNFLNHTYTHAIQFTIALQLLHLKNIATIKEKSKQKTNMQT